MQVFNYASYARAFEFGVSKPNMTKIAKALFEPIVGAEGVVNRAHNPYVIDSKYAKAWYQQDQDIPENIKKAAGRQDIIDGIGDYFASYILDLSVGNSVYCFFSVNLCVLCPRSGCIWKSN